jgi:hypothetical protein
VIDLGAAGPSTYERWGKSLGCPVAPLQKLELENFGEIRQALSAGLGRIVDAHGLDWWELISIRFHEQLERILRLRKLVAEINPDDEIFVSRSGFHSQTIQFLLGRKVHSLLPGDSLPRRLRRAADFAQKLRFHQQLQILGDKYDAGYRIRRLVAGRRQASARQVVLLPTAYVSVSRTLLSYATTVPELDFLLVTTRQSGWIGIPPENVTVARLASYAPGKYRAQEYKHLRECWRELLPDLDRNHDLLILKQLHAFDGVPSLLGEGLAIRDAWLQVFAAEPVSSVLCADDSNPYTHLPLWIAHQRGLPAISCHHGALDGRYLFKRSHADLVLAKGRMEKDYLVNTCGVPEEKVEIAAPPGSEVPQLDPERRRNLIVFFSEPFENSGGRCNEFYGEVLPRLADLAALNHCELVVKLHPQESLRERRSLVTAALSPRQRTVTRVVDGPLTEELLRDTWFALTLISTTAVDCTLRGIPVFLCAWLDFSSYGYMRQFIKFGAGTRLGSADKIHRIPHLLTDLSPGNTRDLWQSMGSEPLKQLLCGPLKLAAAV